MSPGQGNDATGREAGPASLSWAHYPPAGAGGRAWEARFADSQIALNLELRTGAGIQYETRLQLACDTYSNAGLELLDLNADAIATSTFQCAMCMEAVSAMRGNGNFNPTQGSGNA